MALQADAVAGLVDAPAATRAAATPSGYLRLGEIEPALRRDPIALLARGVQQPARWLHAQRKAMKFAGLASASDATLLEGAIERLKATGVIEYTGEYGAELTTFIPFAFWLKTQGLLAGRRVLTYAGMRPYYYFLDDDEFGEKPAKRRYIVTGERDWPTNTTWHATRKPWHVVPDYRTQYRNQGMSFRRPVLFIQNKLTVEHRRGPINFLPLNSLERLLALTAPHFDVVYSRPGSQVAGSGYAADENDFCDYPDHAVVRRFDHVLDLEAHCATTGAPYNLTKLEMLAKSRLMVAAQGGGAHLMAYFGGSLLLLLHYFGDELPHAYAYGPYKHLASPPPVLLVARRQKNFERGVEVMGAVRPLDDDLWLDRRTLPALNCLRF